MAHFSFRKVSINFSICTRFKYFTAVDVTNMEYVKRAAYVVAVVYMQEINAEKKMLAKTNKNIVRYINDDAGGLL
jgi:hypothetical protein